MAGEVASDPSGDGNTDQKEENDETGEQKTVRPSQDIQPSLILAEKQVECRGTEKQHNQRSQHDVCKRNGFVVPFAEPKEKE
jgi:hypothetical protein